METDFSVKWGASLSTAKIEMQRFILVLRRFVMAKTTNVRGTRATAR